MKTNVFDQMLALNLGSGYVLSRAVLPTMLMARHASIVNVAAKAAFDHGADVRGTGVRVNSILPSIIDTTANRQAMPTADFTTWPKPQDIAQVVLFLCSDIAKAVHVAAVSVYGNS